MAWFRQWLHGGGDAGPEHRTAGPASGGVAAGPPRSPDPAEDVPADVPEDEPADVPEDEPPHGHPGERFGLPESGPGSVATTPRRGAQFLLDVVLAGLVAALFTVPEPPQNWSLLAWAIFMIVPVAAIGMTPAMVVLGMRVVRLDRPEAVGVGLLWTLVRTASVFFIVPALLVDRDRRGVQDRASRTVVVRTR